MARVYVSLGSNVEREQRIREAVAELRAIYTGVELSPVYDSAAVGFDGNNFLNLVAGFDSDADVATVTRSFHDIETRLGRDRRLPKFASRSIDLDILLYDDLILDAAGICVPRPEILVNAFVLKPLQDIAPTRLHPEAGQNFASLWQAMAPGAPPLHRYPLQFN